MPRRRRNRPTGPCTLTSGKRTLRPPHRARVRLQQSWRAARPRASQAPNGSPPSSCAAGCARCSAWTSRSSRGIASPSAPTRRVTPRTRQLPLNAARRPVATTGARQPKGRSALLRRRTWSATSACCPTCGRRTSGASAPSGFLAPTSSSEPTRAPRREHWPHWRSTSAVDALRHALQSPAAARPSRRRCVQCHHRLHVKCSRKWLHRRRCCPYCQVVLFLPPALARRGRLRRPSPACSACEYDAFRA
eukprot:scaffold222785_cov30-Tisochrysis_lutea.AAC.2